MRELKRPAIILYYDRNHLLLNTVSDVLEFAGWYVKTTSDTGMALALAESPQHFDLMILNVEPLGFGGLEITRHALLKEHRRETPIILVSLDDLAEEARQAGADAFLRKPNNLIELVDTIKNLLAAPASGAAVAPTPEWRSGRLGL